jgi:hypothetical protein
MNTSKHKCAQFVWHCKNIIMHERIKQEHFVRYRCHINVDNVLVEGVPVLFRSPLSIICLINNHNQSFDRSRSDKIRQKIR